MEKGQKRQKRKKKLQPSKQENVNICEELKPVKSEMRPPELPNLAEKLEDHKSKSILSTPLRKKLTLEIPVKESEDSDDSSILTPSPLDLPPKQPNLLNYLLEEALSCYNEQQSKINQSMICASKYNRVMTFFKLPKELECFMLYW